jgi:uncharacterized surface protein with fasciclin (FAS1) repeats
LKNVVETAIEAGTFQTLVKAIKEAGLVDVLTGDGPFTVFAPTDEAFSKLPEGTLDNLLRDKEKLQSILKYHVVPQKVMASAVMELKQAKTVEGRDLHIDTSDGVTIDDAHVIKPDIECTNGVIHILDKVLIPK